MSSYREIVTKAIIGKCKKTTTANFEIECETLPDTVLGCWVINHNFTGNANQGKASITGSYDINVWYSHDNDTKTAVCTRKFNYSDIMNVNLKNDTKIDDTSEILVTCLKQPTVTDVNIKNGKVYLKVEKELGVEVIGNTTVKVAVEDEFDDYEEIFDTADEEELNINIDSLSDDYLEKDN